jgi:hypothetical protein
MPYQEWVDVRDYCLIFANMLQPHQTATANLLDPHIEGGSRHHEDAIKHSHGGKAVGGGAEQADREHRNVGTTSADATRVADTDLPHPNAQGSSHTGRNAAIGGGIGAGAAGLAAQ